MNKITVPYSTNRNSIVLEILQGRFERAARPCLPPGNGCGAVARRLLFCVRFFCVGSLFAANAARAQTLPPNTPPETEAPLLTVAEPPVWQDLRTSVIAHRDLDRSKRPASRRLSKNELESLRRVVREHAKNNPLQTAVNN